MAFTGNTTLQLEQVNSNTTNPSAVYNYLRPNAFRFSIRDIPHVAYTCQSANLPAIQLGFALQPTPFVDIPRIGDKLNYAEFTIRFLIAEDMVNYRELLEWIVALGFPNNYDDYTSFTGGRLTQFPFRRGFNGETETIAYSDGILTILDSANVPKTRILFKDLFPVSVEALDFDVTSSAVEFFVGIASFKYRTFEIETI
jgi:hypothetical protein